MKKIGFLSFGHWTDSPHSQTRSAADTLLQSIDLAVAAEELGADGAYFRVHHFARQLASPFPLLAAIGAKTDRIEIGTGVIDMRYENPMYMVEDAGAADLIAGGRLQLGISRGSPEQVVDGWRHFGYQPAEGQTDADMARMHTELFLKVLEGGGFAEPAPRPMFPNPPGLLRVEPHAPGLRDRIWWGAGSNGTAVWAAKQGMNLMSSTLKFDEGGAPFHVQQADQIKAFRKAYKGPRSVCGVHNYSDTNRFRQTGTKAIIKALGCKQIWLTEAGGLYKFVGYKADQKRQLRATKYMFKVAKANKKIKRLYVYSWFGAPRSARFDSGLINPNGTPRKAYAEVRKHVK